MVKNTIRLAILVFLALLWFPNFGPSDFIVVWIISKIGMQTYIILSIIFAIYLYHTIEGRGIKGKLRTIKDEIKYLLS